MSASLLTDDWLVPWFIVRGVQLMCVFLHFQIVTKFFKAQGTSLPTVPWTWASEWCALDVLRAGFGWRQRHGSSWWSRRRRRQWSRWRRRRSQRRGLKAGLNFSLGTRSGIWKRSVERRKILREKCNYENRVRSCGNMIQLSKADLSKTSEFLNR